MSDVGAPAITRARRRRSARSSARGPLGVLGALVVVYIAVPLVAFVVRLSTSTQRGFHVPGLFPALWLSICCATVAVAIAAVVGVPLAYVLARSRGVVATAVGVLVQVPLALPPLMSGIILIYVIGPYTTIGRFFHGDLTNSPVGVVIAMSFVSAPFLIVAARAGFAGVDRGLLDVAETLGHSHVSQFARVAVPVAHNSVRAGLLLAWLRAFGEFGAVVVVAYNPTTLPVFTYNQFSGAGLPTTLAPTALAVVAAVVAAAVSRITLPPRRAPAPTPTTATVVPPHSPSPVRFAVDEHLGTFHVAVSCPEPVTHLAVMGPSGAGKSALLRSLAGVSRVRTARIWSGTTDLSALPARDRHVGYLAQGFSLFPHMTVWQNVTFPVRSTDELAHYWLRELRLTGLEDRRPDEISGGQRQRVALAQVLCSQPRLLLLDEPFSALDVPVRTELQRVVRRLQRATGIATVVVTHDAREATAVADEIIVVSEGRSLQAGAVGDVLSRPSSPEVGRLLGIANVAGATVSAPGLLDAGGWTVVADTTGFAPGQAVSWKVEPRDVRVAAVGSNASGDATTARGRVVDVVGTASGVEYCVEVAATRLLELVAHGDRVAPLDVDDACVITFDRASVHLWPSSREDTGMAAAPVAP